MNKEMLISMKSQMIPSPQALEALRQRLAGEVPKRPIPWTALTAAAAAVALAVAAWPVYNAMKPARLHSYETTAVTATMEEYRQTVAEAGPMSGAGRQDPVEEGDAAGHEEAEQPEADAAAQLPAIAAYQALMDSFAGTYPDWYGGAYVDSSNVLVILVTEDAIQDKERLLAITEMTGGSKAIGFTDAKYSMAYLRQLQADVTALPGLKDLRWWGCGVQDDRNQVVLELPQVDDALLAALAELDPDGDAILVQVATAAPMEELAAIKPVGAVE